LQKEGGRKEEGGGRDKCSYPVEGEMLSTMRGMRWRSLNLLASMLATTLDPQLRMAVVNTRQQFTASSARRIRQTVKNFHYQ